MRITLMHNPKAGDGRPTKKELLATLRRAGHRVIYQSAKERGYENALKKETDVVLAAGGDGTVAKIARCLIDAKTPLSVLPLGTANNLARTFSYVMPAEKIIAALENAEKCAVDVGLAHGPWGKRYFFEGVGGGLFADCLKRSKKTKKKRNDLPREQELSRQVAVLRTALENHSARKWKIEIDGEDISRRYILWEAMNIRSVGPVLDFAPSARAHDGKLDFVCVRDEDRGLLLKHLDARLANSKSRFPLPLRTFKKLKILWTKSALHFDDKIWPRKKDRPDQSCEIHIEVKPSALSILRPQ